MSELIDPSGYRLYLTAAERSAFLAAAKAPREAGSFCEVLHFTGCRIPDSGTTDENAKVFAQLPAG